ncbi:MAG: phosphoesterase [Desulfurococcales archaeon ex4484_58]|nr:MAG: phosphoesterase [Desulfurococcales archaeon ex4484_58]
MDGVGAAAIYIYYHGIKPKQIIFTEPYLLDKIFNKISRVRGVDKIVFSDLGLNNNYIYLAVNTLRKLIDQGITIEWYDHHVWEDEWIARFKGIGVKINIDRSTCGAGVVAKYAPRRKEIDEKYVDELVKGICAGDLFKFDHWRGPWFLRLVRRRDDDKWRLYVLEKLVNGNGWCKEFTEKVVERLEQELNGYNLLKESLIIKEMNGIKIAVAPQIEFIENSFSAAYIIGRFGVDIVAITSRDGKISLRSLEYNIRDLALKLGGGGHPRAAGFKLKIPLSIKLKQLIDKKTLLNYVLEILVDAIEKSGGLNRIQ